MSLGQLCDDGCNVELDKLNLRVYKDGDLIIKGLCSYQDGLWNTLVKTAIQNNNYALPNIHPSI